MGKKSKFALPLKQLALAHGGLAHLVERKHGMFEVIGSSPISSTKRLKAVTIVTAFLFRIGLPVAYCAVKSANDLPGLLNVLVNSLNLFP